MQTVSFQIQEQLHSKLEYLAKLQDRSKGYIVRKAVESYLQDQEDIQAAEKALEEFYNSERSTFSLQEIKEENEL